MTILYEFSFFVEINKDQPNEKGKSCFLRTYSGKEISHLPEVAVWQRLSGRQRSGRKRRFQVHPDGSPWPGEAGGSPLEVGCPKGLVSMFGFANILVDPKLEVGTKLRKGVKCPVLTMQTITEVIA